MENTKISIIIPIYNAEAFLKRCLDSIQQQSYKNIEVLMVNDGSKDNSVKICEKYSQEDTRFVTYTQKNEGQSAARNKGLELSTGQYVSFIDADDYVHSDYLKRLYDELSAAAADIAMCNFKYFSGNTAEESSDNQKHTPLFAKRIIEGSNLLKEMHQSKDEPFVVVWGKLFRKKMFENVRFPVGRIWEDYEVLYKIFDKANKLTIFDEILYYYFRGNQNSETYKLGEKFYVDMIYVLDNEIEYMTEKGHQDIIHLIVKRYLYWLIEYYKTCGKKEKEKKKKIICRYRELFLLSKDYIGEKMYKGFNLFPDVYVKIKKWQSK